MSASTSFKPSIRDAGELTDSKLYGSFRSLNRYEAPVLKSKHEDIFKNKEFESAQVSLPPKPSSGKQQQQSDDKQHKKSSNRSKRADSNNNNNNNEEKKSKSKNKHKSIEREKKDDEFIKYLGERHERRRKNKYSNDEMNQDNFESSSVRKMNSSKERLHKPEKEEHEKYEEEQEKVKPDRQKFISKLNAFSANSKSDNESDSDNNDNNNNIENEVEIDVQRLGSASKQYESLKVNQNSEFVKSILNFNTAEFVLTPPPQGTNVNCKILCRRGLINEYHFFLEQSDSPNILLLKTHKKMASAKASHFIDVINYNELGQRSTNEISCAKCSSNMARKKFKLNINNNSFPLVQPNNILNVLFRSNSGEPRKVISTALLCNGTTSSKEKITYVLKNRPPHYDINMRKFVLNYNGRAKQSSKNNFQIYDESLPDEILMQLGKVETGEYNCDYTWPLCAMQAFGLALASLSR